MSAVCSVLTEDQFLCSICLDVFTGPVTIPCGHNFCKHCITKHWNVNVQSKCPVCSEAFGGRPELRVNTFISEMVAQFRRSGQKDDLCVAPACAGTGEVFCDVCPGTEQKALKSCLVCLTSYCQTHLELHQKITGLKRHALIDPVGNLEERMCKKHDRLLELFCKTDQVCVCQFCTESHHKDHHVVPLTEEYKHKKDKLANVEAETRQMIQQRRLKIEQIQQAVKVSREDAGGETADCVHVFAAVVKSAERSLAQRLEAIQEKQKRVESLAEGLIRQLEEEVSKLAKRSSDVEQLLHTEDHLHLIQRFASTKASPPTKDWTGVSVQLSHWGSVRRALADLQETLSQDTLCTGVELSRAQQYAVDVTLDPDTASVYLMLSDDGKQVKSIEKPRNAPDRPQRFSVCNGVLGEQSFSAGRFYYEVQVGGKTEWDLGVARESVCRKGKVRLSPKHGYWTVWLRNGDEYKALAGPGVFLSLKSQPQKVGVFVDYEGGLVSFYDVDAQTLIYSFTDCAFAEKLYPYFSPCSNGGGTNSAPLVLLPVCRPEGTLPRCP